MYSAYGKPSTVPPGSEERLQILALGSNVFHVLRADHPELVDVVAVGTPTSREADVIGALLDWLTQRPKAAAGQLCWTITTIIQWPDGHTEIYSKSACQPL
jgi:hypothetical protein